MLPNEALDSLESTLTDVADALPCGPVARLRECIAAARLAPDPAGQLVALGRVRTALNACLQCVSAEEV